MKTLPTALAAHLAGGGTTTAVALKITRTDGQVFAWTTADVSTSALGDGVLYQAGPGMLVTGIEQTAGLAVDNLELSTLDDGTVFDRAEVLAGVWQNAAFVLVRYNWASPTDGTEPLLAGTLGEGRLRGADLVIELRGLQQYLQQAVGNVTSKTCRARLADYPVANGSNRCRLSAAALWVPGVVTTAASQRQFTGNCTSGAATRADDYFGLGQLEWLTGGNAGVRSSVLSYNGSGVHQLSLSVPHAIQAGDTYRVLPGCRKRRTEDCAAKFSNVLNFAGEPDMPGVDALTSSPVVDV